MRARTIQTGRWLPRTLSPSSKSDAETTEMRVSKRDSIPFVGRWPSPGGGLANLWCVASPDERTCKTCGAPTHTHTHTQQSQVPLREKGCVSPPRARASTRLHFETAPRAAPKSASPSSGARVVSNWCSYVYCSEMAPGRARSPRGQARTKAGFEGSRASRKEHALWKDLKLVSQSSESITKECVREKN